EVFLRDYGWVAMDPADVGKGAREETSEWLKIDTPLVEAGRPKRFRRRGGGHRPGCHPRPRRRAARREEGGQARLPDVSAGRDGAGAAGQPRPGQLQVHDHLARDQALSARRHAGGRGAAGARGVASAAALVVAAILAGSAGSDTGARLPPWWE